jgi:hypothetical protein
MELNNEPFADFANRRLPYPAGRDLDWSGLRARLQAQHAVCRLFADLALAPARSIGSFAPTAAGTVAEMQQGLSRINRTSLGDGKTSERIALGIIGKPKSGDRG